jgi:hypothetical protein
MAQTFGFMVSEARARAGLSLRALGKAMGGLSAPYLHDVEHGRRKLSPVRWPALVAALPTLTVRALAEAAVLEGPVEIDARDLTPGQRARIVDALEQAATSEAA